MRYHSYWDLPLYTHVLYSITCFLRDGLPKWQDIITYDQQSHWQSERKGHRFNSPQLNYIIGIMEEKFSKPHLNAD